MSTDLKKARETLGLTQEQIATRLGITRKWWGTMERGQAAVPPTVALAVAQLLTLHAQNPSPPSSD